MKENQAMISNRLRFKLYQNSKKKTLIFSYETNFYLPVGSAKEVLKLNPNTSIEGVILKTFICSIFLWKNNLFLTGSK